jgi:hypothetical protein
VTAAARRREPEHLRITILDLGGEQPGYEHRHRHDARGPDLAWVVRDADQVAKATLENAAPGT